MHLTEQILIVSLTVLILFYPLFFLCIALLQRKNTQSPAVKNLHKITMILACFNEEKMVNRKIKNCLELDYPKDKLKIIFADGGSTDKTKEIIRSFAKKNKNITLVETTAKGKVPQINEVLPAINAEIIVISDCDGMLTKNTLIEFSKEFNKSDKVGAVGAYVSPADSVSEEQQYWGWQNKLRLLESNFYSPSIMIGVCYAFRKGIIKQYPENVIADDIYATFETINNGYRVVYSQFAKACEARVPQTLEEMIVHKSRKANAYLIELFRFAKKFISSPLRWKLIFYTKLLQFTIAPIAFFVLIGIGILKITQLLSSEQGIILLVFVIAEYSILQRFKITKTLNNILISQSLLLITLMRYPFYRQTSSYKKIR